MWTDLKQNLTIGKKIKSEMNMNILSLIRIMLQLVLYLIGILWYMYMLLSYPFTIHLFSKNLPVDILKLIFIYINTWFKSTKSFQLFYIYYHIPEVELTAGKYGSFRGTGMGQHSGWTVWLESHARQSRIILWIPCQFIHNNLNIYIQKLQG